MKIRTSEAARNLGIHPSHMFQHIVELAPELPFHDVWPEIDTDWVKTLAALEHRGAPHSTEEIVDQAAVTDHAPAAHGLSDDAVHVLDKLSRQGKWGNVSVAFDSLMNLTHVPKRDLEDVVAELRKRGFLDHDGTGRGTISLNSARRCEIEEIVQQSHGALRCARGGHDEAHA